MSARERIAGGTASFIDERTGAAKWMKKTLTKVFPDHWSFMLGEIVMYSFVILLLSGTFLTFWFDPSMREVEYEGSYEPLNGIKMSAAYASALHISFDVRGGLLMRQIHHWAALIFMAAMVVHMMRVFFTGAFRKPRELNWIIGVALLTLGIVEGFLGYSLPDDLLSGTGIRIAEAIIQAIPVWLLPLLLYFRRRIPGRDVYPTHLRSTYSANPWNHAGTDNRASNVGLVPEAHSISRSWSN